MSEISSIESIINPGSSIHTVETNLSNTVNTTVEGGNTVVTTHNVVPQVQTIIQEDNTSVTSVINGFWNVVWSVNGQTGDVLIDVVMSDFTENTTYTKNAVVYHNKKVYRAKNTFTSTSTFNPNDWTEVNTSATALVEGFTANHRYTKDEMITVNGKLYTAKNTFTSGSAFVEGDWNAVGGGESEWGSIVGTISNQTDLQTALDAKVDEEEGKGLSSNDYTDGDKNKLDSLNNAFVATYGTTPFADIVAAINAGRAIYCKKTTTVGSIDQTVYVPITRYNTNGVIFFGGVVAFGLYSSFKVNSSNVWTSPVDLDNFVVTAQQSLTSQQQVQVQTNIGVKELIPSQASSSNQLADKNFVNSTVQTGTANFRGNWNTWVAVPTDANQYPVDYAGSKIPTVNDYLVVKDASDYSGTTLEGTWRFKYSGVWATNGKSGWNPEYQVNETPMTAAQLAAINSGITANKIAQIDADIATKVDKVTGKGLSTNDYTTEEKNKLAGLPSTISGGAAYCTCTTSASTQVKVATSSSGNFSLATGAQAVILMSSNNTYNGKAKLNIDNTGEKFLLNNQGASNTRYFWKANEVIYVVYNGTDYIMLEQGYATTSYYGITKLSSATNNTSDSLAATASSVKTTYDLANSKATVTVTNTDPGEGESIGDNEIIAVVGNDFLSYFYPVGSIYLSATMSTAAQVEAALGGTWVAWGAGRVPVGVGSNGTTNYTTAEATGGSETHRHDFCIAKHAYYGIDVGDDWVQGVNGSGAYSYSQNTFSKNKNWTGSATVTRGGSMATSTTSASETCRRSWGDTDVADSRQPYITCYMYKRTA